LNKKLNGKSRGNFCSSRLNIREFMEKGRVLIIVSLVFFFLVSSIKGSERLDIPLENSPSFGPMDAPVTIVEFLDYQ